MITSAAFIAAIKVCFFLHLFCWLLDVHTVYRLVELTTAYQRYRLYQTPHSNRSSKPPSNMYLPLSTPRVAEPFSLSERRVTNFGRSSRLASSRHSVEMAS